MCGVVGFYSAAPQAAHIDLFCRLFAESRVRGVHAFGFSAVSTGAGNGVTHRSLSFGESIKQLRSLPDLPTHLIAHTRYSTSGDHETLANNQPLVIQDFSLAFNGVIDMRDAAVWQAENPQPFQWEYHTENDGELFIAWVLSGKPPGEFFKARQCSFAGVWLQGQTLYALRNTLRPLWRMEYQGAVYFASTRDICLRAARGLGEAVIAPVRPGVVMKYGWGVNADV